MKELHGSEEGKYIFIKQSQSKCDQKKVGKSFFFRVTVPPDKYGTAGTK